LSEKYDILNSATRLFWRTGLNLAFL
jgi:hypothetical protein